MPPPEPIAVDGSVRVPGLRNVELNILDNTPEELAAFEGFLVSLTDERVRLQRTPFDHPPLFVTNGYPGSNQHVPSLFGLALDRFLEMPAVGLNGGPPLQKFLE